MSNPNYDHEWIKDKDLFANSFERHYNVIGIHGHLDHWADEQMGLVGKDDMAIAANTILYLDSSGLYVDLTKK